MKECNCWLGILSDYDQSDLNNLNLSNIKNRLNEKSNFTKNMASISHNWESYEPKDYVDRRKGLATLFNYCPLCGKKIEWDTIRKMLKEKKDE